MSPEPNLVPNGLHVAEEDEPTCASCLHFEHDGEAEYGTCTAFSHLVQPNLVCNSYSRPDAA